MGKGRAYPRRNGDKDLSALVRIFEKLEFEDFMSLFNLFDNYRDKTSSLRILRLLYDALAIGRVRQVKALAPILAAEAEWAKSLRSRGSLRERVEMGVTPMGSPKKKRNLGVVKDNGEADILNSGLTEKMRHKT